MMDSLEIVAVNEGIRVIKVNVPLTLARHHSDIKLKFALKSHCQL